MNFAAAQGVGDRGRLCGLANGVSTAMADFHSGSAACVGLSAV